MHATSQQLLYVSAFGSLEPIFNRCSSDQQHRPASNCIQPFGYIMDANREAATITEAVELKTVYQLTLRMSAVMDSIGHWLGRFQTWSEKHGAVEESLFQCSFGLRTNATLFFLYTDTLPFVLNQNPEILLFYCRSDWVMHWLFRTCICLNFIDVYNTYGSGAWLNAIETCQGYWLSRWTTETNC